MASYEKELLKITREVARLEREQRKLKRQTTLCKQNLRLARRHRKALLRQLAPPNTLPSRLFGDGVGTVVSLQKKAAVPDIKGEDLV